MNIEQSLRESEVVEGKYYGIIPFSSIESTADVVSSNIAIAPVSDKLPWVLHRFYLKRFMTAKVGQLSSDGDPSEVDSSGNATNDE